MQSFDPNHWKKVFRGNDKGTDGASSLIAIKRRLKITNVLGTEDQTRMVELLATCVKQHRKTATAKATPTLTQAQISPTQAPRPNKTQPKTRPPTPQRT